MEDKRPYYIGIDLGTSSVGWAVTDEDYNILKYKKKNLWGARLFEKGETAQARREKRSLRRRLKRRVHRIKLLQDIFKDEIAKVDNKFFLRLNESNIIKKIKMNLYLQMILYLQMLIIVIKIIIKNIQQYFI